MDVIRYPDDPRPDDWRRVVLALGNFDGVHLGHRAIIERVVGSAADRGATPVVLTFDPHPTRIVRPLAAPPLLMTTAQKAEVLGGFGVRGMAVVPFTPAMAAWDPETFVRLVLHRWLGVEEVWVGANFVFGHDRAGNVTKLRQLGSSYGFRAEAIEAVRYKEFVVSSSRARQLITEGRVDEAAALLGRHYFLDGIVVHGLQRGRTLGVPTATIDTPNELLPPDGVYATLATIDGIAYPAVTNIGVRPTFHLPSAIVVETHVLDMDRDLYGKTMRVAFVHRIREERTFDGVESLKAQISADCQSARRLLATIPR